MDTDQASVDSDAARKVTALEEDRPLGMGFKGKPPGILEVTKVSEGTWAHRQDIQVGDFIVAVNDEDLQYMTLERFKELFALRPLVITIDPPDTPEGSEAEEDLEPTYWRYVPPNGKPIMPRKHPYIVSEFNLEAQPIEPLTLVEIIREHQHEDGTLYLQLRHGAGWLYDRRPDTGPMCIREEEYQRLQKEESKERKSLFKRRSTRVRRAEEEEEAQEAKKTAGESEEADEARKSEEEEEEARKTEEEGAKAAKEKAEESEEAEEARKSEEEEVLKSEEQDPEEVKRRSEASEKVEDARKAEDAVQGEREAEDIREPAGTQAGIDLVGLKITIVSAAGLRKATSFSEGGALCVCESPGCFEFVTRVFKKSLSPTWNHVEECSYKVGSGGIKFTVRDKSTRGPLLGEVHLKEMEFYPDGFSGELDLQDAGQDTKAKLKVLVRVQELEDLEELQSTLADARKRLTAEAAQAREAEELQRELTEEKAAAAEVPLWEDRMSSLEDAQSAAEAGARDDASSREEERHIREELDETKEKLRLGKSEILAAEMTHDRDTKLAAEHADEVQHLQERLKEAERAEEASEAKASRATLKLDSDRATLVQEGAELGRLKYETEEAEEHERLFFQRAEDAEAKLNLLSGENADVDKRLKVAETASAEQKERLTVMIADRDSEAVEVGRLRVELERVEARSAKADRMLSRSNAKLEKQRPPPDAGLEQVIGHVPLSFKLDGLSYERLVADALLMAQVSDAVADAISPLAGVPDDDVQVLLTSGSVAEVKVQQQDTGAVLDAHKKLVAAAAAKSRSMPSDLEVALTMAVEGVPGIASAADGTIEISNMKILAPVATHTLARQLAETDKEVAFFYAEKIEGLRQELAAAQAEADRAQEVLANAATLQSEEISNAARALVATEAARTALSRGAALLSDQTVELIAGPADKVLGMALDSSPGRLVVRDVSEQGWAAQNGIEVGAVVTALDEQETSIMSVDKWKTLLKKRPLKFSVQLPWTALPVSASAAELGAALTPLAEMELLRAELYEARVEVEANKNKQKADLMYNLDGYLPSQAEDIIDELQEEASQVNRLSAYVGMEEATVADLRRRVRDARMDAAEAAAAAYFAQNSAQSSAGSSYDGTNPLKINAKLSDTAGGDPLSLAASMHHERKVCQDLRRELYEVEDAAVETAEAAETRVNQIEHAMRGRRIAFQTAEHAAETEAQAREEAYAELHQANAVARTARTTAAQLRDELERAQRATWHEGIVADDLRREIVEVTNELAVFQGGNVRRSQVKKNPMRSSKRRELSPTAQAEELRRTAEELRESVKNWRAKSPPYGQPDSPEPWTGPWQSLQEKAMDAGYMDDSHPQRRPDTPKDSYYADSPPQGYQDEDDWDLHKVGDKALTIQRQFQHPARTVDRSVPYLHGAPEPPFAVPSLDDEDYDRKKTGLRRRFS